MNNDNVMFPFLLGLVFMLGTFAMGAMAVSWGLYLLCAFFLITWGGTTVFFFREAYLALKDQSNE